LLLFYLGQCTIICCKKKKKKEREGVVVGAVVSKLKRGRKWFKESDGAAINAVPWGSRTKRL